MLFNFERPVWLLLLPIAAALVVILYRKVRGMRTFRKNSILILRMLVLLLIILSMAGFGLKKTSGETTNILVLDGSDSTKQEQQRMVDWVRDALKNKRAEDKVGVVNFASNAAVEFPPSSQISFDSLQTLVNTNFTNIEGGLKLAASLIPSEDRKRIVLATDGEENSGDALKQVRLLRQQGITVDVLPVKRDTGPEVLVQEVAVPESLRMNEKFEVTVDIESTVDTSAVLRLYAEKQLAFEKSVQLSRGENSFSFSDTALTGGMVVYTAEVLPTSDTITINNKKSTFSYVEDVARILVIQDEDEGASELVRMLEEDVRVEVVSPGSVPVTPEGLQRYDAFIISNVSADKLDDKFLSNLESCVRNQGKGLLVTGGENSYAPGGYYKTELEKILPVNVDIKPKEEAPNLGLVLVIDKSGSMTEGRYGVSKMELAKEAAIRSSEVLTARDQIGVIAFDGAAQWVVKTQKVNNLQSIQDAIGTIRGDGGTQILPALQEAYVSLKEADTKLKHIILLTDGQAEKAGYAPVIEGMKEHGITLSTVAVGSEADVMLLKALAQDGGGRFYMTDEFTDIPKIFAKETFLAGKTYLNNRTFTPSLKSYSQVLNGIEAVPDLDGYVGTTPKSTARVVLTSDTDDPILAVWQYGLGRTIAWTPDAKGMWTSAWLRWGQSSRFWKNLVSWILQSRSKEEYSIRGGVSSGKGTVELTLPPEDRLPGEQAGAVMVGPEGSEQQIVLEPISPGVYRGSFEIGETGVYIANIRISGEGETVKTISSGVSIPYSPEYGLIRNDAEAFLTKLAYEGGGRVLTGGDDLFSGKLEEVESIADMTWLLLTLALLFFMLEITLRRLKLPLDRWIFALSGRAGKLKTAVSGLAVGYAKKSGLTEDAVTSSMPVKEPASDEAANEERKAVRKVREKSSEPAKASTASHVEMLLAKKKRREGK